MRIINHLSTRFKFFEYLDRIMKAAHLLVVILLGSIFSIGLTSVSADSSGLNDPALISIDVENGASSDDSILFSGIIEDEVIPSEFYWRVAKEGVEFDGGDLKSDLVNQVSTGSRDQWSWSFELLISATGECACYVSLISEDSEGIVTREMRLVFMAQINSTNELHGFIINDAPSGEFVSGQIQVDGWASTYSSGSLSSTIRIESSVSLISSFSEVSIYPDSTPNCSPEILLEDIESGDFTISQPVGEKLDGWYVMEIIFCDNLGNGISYSFSIKVNNQGPVIYLDGIEVVNEANSWHVFDASQTEDPYWGGMDLYYVWTLRKPSHTGQLPVDVIMGNDVDNYVVSGSQSGNYSLSLTVYDLGGKSSTKIVEFEIINLNPTSVLIIDEELVEFGQEIKVKNTQSIILDATQSTDSENDIGALRCVWIFNNTVLYEGCQRTFSWPDSSLHRSELTLEVIDDDGAFDTTSVILIHPNEVQEFPMAIILFVVSFLFFGYSLSRRVRGSDEPKIPKWK